MLHDELDNDDDDYETGRASIEYMETFSNLSADLLLLPSIPLITQLLLALFNYFFHNGAAERFVLLLFENSGISVIILAMLRVSSPGLLTLKV